jgi:GNAT superfamily N-acetyltransferase
VTVRVERWNGQAGVAEQLAHWHVQEWQNVFPNWTVQKAVAEFNAQLHTYELPATWLAFKDDVLIGSISALLEDATELNDLPGPWLASFYIVPEWRGQGAAQLLMDAAMQAVKKLGYKKWYLFTPHHQAYYAKQGWVLIENRRIHHENVAVMAQEFN